MFDYLICEYPLPLEGANEWSYQTKSTPSQFLDNYQIDKQGYLWYESYETEDRSDSTATGFARWAGMMTRVNHKWERDYFTGEIRFYGPCEYLGDDNRWVEWSAYFIEGILKELVLIKDEQIE